MGAKINRINEEITKTKAKILEFQARLRELERQKIETENAEIVLMVRGVDVAPEELKAFIEAFKKQQAGGIAHAPAGLEEKVNED